ncbi:MAG: hypothetical protein IJM50_03380 [Lachnospiraceae bacterium]|nr:hypothetical protein [Lachnospiraceae bacterium]
MKRYVHFSIDDVFDTFKDLAEGSYEDIFEQPVLGFLKDLHLRYGCTFSGYCFFRKELPAEGAETKSFLTLDDFSFPKRFREQFWENHSWLKFGFHALDHETSYGPTHFKVRETRGTYEEAREDCKKTHDALCRLLGCEDMIDHVPRIHYFAGSKEALGAWKDLQIRGLLSADDDRIPYDLTEEETLRLKEDFFLNTPDRDLFLIRTALRLEKTEDVNRAWESLLKEEKPCIEIFTHEYFMDEPSIRKKFEGFSRLVKEEGLAYGFAEDAFA